MPCEMVGPPPQDNQIPFLVTGNSQNPRSVKQMGSLEATHLTEVESRGRNAITQMLGW